MRDARRRLNPRTAPEHPPEPATEDRKHITKGRTGRRRNKLDMATMRKQWPKAVNADRLDTIEDLKRSIQIYREQLKLPEVSSNHQLKALIFEAMALAERCLRRLEQARP